MIETIEDIVRDMRDDVRTSQENNPDPRTRIFLSTSNMAIEDFADRIKAAHRREMDGLVASINALEKTIEEVCEVK